MTEQCTLLQHGVSMFRSHIGTCCYNKNDPKKYSNYEVDPTECWPCIDQESHNIKSYRQGVNEKYGLNHDHRSPIVLDITPNISCNLACKICNELSSTTWAKIKKIQIRKNYSVSVVNFKSMIDNFDLSNVKEINFSGGEPFLNNNIIKYVNALKNKVDFKNCELRFSTNGTLPLTQKLAEFFLQFRLVSARFSIDDVEQGFEYQRYPAKWQQCQKNWELFLDNLPHNVIPSINRTVSILNITRLHLLNQWHANYKVTKFGDSVELIDHFAFGSFGLEAMPSQLKKYIKESNLDLAWSYVKNRIPSSNSANLRSSIQQSDALHQTNLKNFDPVLHRIIFQ